MKRFKNDLGWHFLKTRSGLWIRREDPSKIHLRNRIIKAILFLIMMAAIFFVVLTLKGYPPEAAFSIIIFSLLIIVIFSLLGKFWLLQLLYVNFRSYSLIVNSVHIDRRDQRLPCYLFKAEIIQESNPDLFRVYLRPSEFLEVEEPSEDFNPLVWETKDEQEASLIMEELSQCGVGETDPENQHPVIRGNKKAGLLILVCYILCLLAMMFLFVKPSIQSEMANNPNSTKPLLYLIKSVLIFGLLSFIVYAGYNIWFGMKVIKHRQIPPPTRLFFGEIRLFKGEKAVKRGRKIVVFGIIVIVVSLIIAVYADYKLKTMIPPQDNQQTSMQQK